MDHKFPIFCAAIVSCFALFLGGLGVVLIVYAQRSRQKKDPSGSWPKSKGVIVDNGITTERSPKGKLTYIPVVHYIFQANHRMFQGSDIHLGPQRRLKRKKKAQKMLENYPPGCKVWVFFNPQNPEEAVLERKDYDPKQCFILGTTFILLMILLLSLIATWWVNQFYLVVDLML